MAVVTVVVVEVPTAAGATVAAVSTAAAATVEVASTVVAMGVAASMEDRPTSAIAAVGIAAECTAAATLELPALGGLGHLSAEVCGTHRPDFIRLPEEATACLAHAAERWVLPAARAWPQDAERVRASLTGVFILSAGPERLDFQGMHRSTTLALWERAA